MRYALITFLSDFGLLDEYVSACVGVIKSINPKIEIVSLTHQIPPGDILKGSFTLANTLPFFPKNSIHLAVVDPGVGGSRRRIVIKTVSKSLLIGPDNGLFTMVLPLLGGIASVREITNPELKPQNAAPTFEARDIFAPTAALLASGFPFKNVGSEIKTITKLELPQPRKQKNGLELTIIDIDRFGTARFNYSFYNSSLTFPFSLNDVLLFETASLKIIAPLVKTFSQVEVNKPLFFKDSSGYLALAINQGNAAQKFNLKRFQSGILTKAKKNECEG